MTAAELRNKIRTLVKQVYQPKPINIDSDKPISLETEKFPILLQFPSLKKVLVDLLTKQFEIFISDIQWVAPKPTTFRIVLGNGENFMLIWMQRSWVANVEGKRYYLLNLNEEENAISSIARILSYGATSLSGEPAEPADTAVDTGGGNFPEGEGGGDSPGGEGGGGEAETGGGDTETEPVDTTATDTEEA